MRLPKHFSSSLVVLLLGAVVLSSCGTTASLSSSTTTTKTTVSQSTTSTTTATTSTTTSTSSTTSVPPTTTTTATQQSNVVTRCHASQLSFTYSRLGLFASQQLNVIFRYTNTSNATCTLYGYPGIEFYTANGQPIIAKTGRGAGPSPVGYDPDPNLVTLTPGASAYFEVGWTTVDGPTGTTQGCALPTSAKSYPPNSYTQLSLTFQPQPNGQTWVGKAYMCNLSTIGAGLSPVGTSSTFIVNRAWLTSFFTPGNFVS